jgi:large subunit ribosomal protein L21
MYAIIEDRGKQYKATEGATLQIDLNGAQPGDTVTFDKVVVLNDGKSTSVGSPYVDGASVTATVNGDVKGKKIVGIKYKRRKKYRRKWGHRQQYTEVTVTKIG